MAFILNHGSERGETGGQQNVYRSTQMGACLEAYRETKLVICVAAKYLRKLRTSSPPFVSLCVSMVHLEMYGFFVRPDKAQYIILEGSQCVGQDRNREGAK